MALSPDFLHCMILDRQGGGKDVDSQAVQGWSPSDGVLWVHMDVANPHSSKWLAGASGLGDHAIEVLLAEETRPRSAIFDDGLLVVLRGVNTNPGADPEDMVSIRLWIDGDRIISTRRRKLLSVHDIREELKQGRGPAAPGFFLPALVERLADRIGAFVDTIDDQLDAAESGSAAQSVSEARVGLASLRRQIAEVRRFLAPQRDALDRLIRHPSPWLEEDNVLSLRQEADRVTRYLEDLDLGRERAIVLQEELLSRIAQEQNSRMYVLSVVAAVFLPLTFITGLLGMNVGGLPGLDSELGFMTSLLVMVLAGAGLLLFFRWKNWL